MKHILHIESCIKKVKTIYKSILIQHIKVEGLRRLDLSCVKYFLFTEQHRMRNDCSLYNALFSNLYISGLSWGSPWSQNTLSFNWILLETTFLNFNVEGIMESEVLDLGIRINYFHLQRTGIPNLAFVRGLYIALFLPICLFIVRYKFCKNCINIFWKYLCTPPI